MRSLVICRMLYGSLRCKRQRLETQSTHLILSGSTLSCVFCYRFLFRRRCLHLWLVSINQIGNWFGFIWFVTRRWLRIVLHSFLCKHNTVYFKLNTNHLLEYIPISSQSFQPFSCSAIPYSQDCPLLSHSPLLCHHPPPRLRWVLAHSPRSSPPCRSSFDEQWPLLRTFAVALPIRFQCHF